MIETRQTNHVQCGECNEPTRYSYLDIVGFTPLEKQHVLCDSCYDTHENFGVFVCDISYEDSVVHT